MKRLERAPRALWSCLSQCHDDHRLRFSRRLYRRLLRRFSPHRNDLFARRAWSAFIRIRSLIAIIRSLFADLYIVAARLFVKLLSDLTYVWIDPRVDFETGRFRPCAPSCRMAATTQTRATRCPSGRRDRDLDPSRRNRTLILRLPHIGLSLRNSSTARTISCVP
jgi:hypothetical protein